MLIPGWRGAPPEEVSKAISATLRNNGRATTKVVERYVANSEDAALVPFTVPIVTWGMFRALSARRADRLVRVGRGADDARAGARDASPHAG